MRTRDLLAGILVAVIWGSNFSVIEIGLGQLDPFVLTALRFTFCALPLIFFLKKPANVGLKVIAAYGLLFGVGLWWVVNMAMYLGLPAGISSLVLQFSAFFTIILSAAIFKERISAGQTLGMGSALLGLLLLLRFRDEGSTLVGLALVLLGALSWSICNLIIKHNKPSDMISFIVWSSAFSAPALFLMTYLVEGSKPFTGIFDNMGIAAICSVLFQAYITTIFGYMVWNNLIKKYSAAKVAPLSLLVPVSGLLTSHWLFHEPIDIPVCAAICLILTGIAIFIKAQSLGEWINRRVQP
ncbi:MAG: EamA family transporter [Janthinobacterium lividum]